ncbi:MAG: DNA replication/repair protein RecF [Christensenellales bacterium]
MQIEKLYLKNFRNYKEQLAEFSDGLNVLYGENAAGKTNMLEAIYLSSLAKSPRTSKEKELVLNGEKNAVIKVLVKKQFREHKIEIQIDEKGKKRVMIDSIPVNRAGELLGIVAIVYFSPDEMKLVKESPDNRRRFLDISLSQESKSYFNNLVKYNKILKQRNNLLKESFNKNIDLMLDVWDRQLATVGIEIIEQRRAYVEKLKTEAKKIHDFLSGGKESLDIEYESELDEISDKNLYLQLKKNREKDKKLTYTTIGPHRDDIKLMINGSDARKFASQGQQRSIALSLKFGQLELYKQETTEKPILLLDDVLSELDENRKAQLLELSSGCQTILTCTEYDGEAAKKLHVINGKLC